MAKPIKFTDRNKDWVLRPKKNQSRLCDTRVEREYILIVCEGIKTEPNYFEAFKKNLPKNTVEISISGLGANTLSLVDKAQQIGDKKKNVDIQFDQVWVVFDRDSFAPCDFDNAIKKAESDGMRCAWSNEAFEFWYILHFEYRDTEMNRDGYKRKLSEEKLLNEPYKKNDPEMYEKLKTKGNQAQAIKWAKSLYDNFKNSAASPSSSNPCTTVYALVEELNKFLNP